jgi:predicted O-methyltransferase YrrM
LSKFSDLWKEICKRSACFPVVQEYSELEYVYNLIEGCESYLEVGTAEGNSLYVLSHALKKGAKIVFVDFGEQHTALPREWVLAQVKATPIYGNSHSPNVIHQAKGKYDVVMIDAGHSYNDVKADAENYGCMATKYIIFHDINLPEVRKAFDEYAQGKKSHTISNSPTFGYGIVTL